jgi:hypothetical protein
MTQWRPANCLDSTATLSRCCASVAETARQEAVASGNEGLLKLLDEIMRYSGVAEVCQKTKRSGAAQPTLTLDLKCGEGRLRSSCGWRRTITPKWWRSSMRPTRPCRRINPRRAPAPMSERARRRRLASCACGRVELQLLGEPITCVVCYCDDCQEGARQIEALPGAPPVQDPDGGTGCLVYRKDRVTCGRGASYLRPHKIKDASVTNRMVATCCNSAMLLNFDDSKPWVDVYRSRCHGDVPALQMRICTRFKPKPEYTAGGVRSFPGYPIRFLAKLMLAWMAMRFGRRVPPDT